MRQVLSIGQGSTNSLGKQWSNRHIRYIRRGHRVFGAFEEIACVLFEKGGFYFAAKVG